MSPCAEPIIDLHVHSTCSDGLSTPTELVRLAHESGLTAIALCDHDSIDGIEEALTAGAEYGVTVIPGVELSSLWGFHRDIHLLGYGIDHQSPSLRSELEEFRSFRLKRNRQILNRVNERLRSERREPLDFLDVQAIADGAMGRPHIARLLVKKKYVVGMEEAFQRYLIPCNVAKRHFPLDQAISLVHDAGGIAVMAHPLLVTSDHDALHRLFDEFTAMGLDGIEAYTPGATEADIDFFVNQARKRGLVITGGSDFHGSPAGPATPGSNHDTIPIPPACLTEIQRAVAARRLRIP